MPYKSKEDKASYNKLWKQKNKAHLKKYFEENKEHLLQLNYDWKLRNPDKTKQAAKKAYIKKYYGLSIEQYEEIFNKFNYQCAICGKHDSLDARSLHVDHDHVTLEIRGVLCYSCNRTLIGNKRDPSIFRKAADYLEGPFTGYFVPKNPPKRKKKR
jgi:hypothetical protein